MAHYKPNPALQGLDALIGEWEMANPQDPGVHWEASDDGSQWKHDFDLSYTRIGAGSLTP